MPNLEVVSLFSASHPRSSFDCVLSGVVPPPSLSHTVELLEEIVRILKPSGTLLIREPVTTGSTARFEILIRCNIHLLCVLL